MSQGFLKLNNKITALTNEVFENSFELYENVNKNNKIFIILDNNRKIKEVYERLYNISFSIHIFDSKVFYIKDIQEINTDIWDIIDSNTITDVIFIFDDNQMLEDIIGNLHNNIKDIVNNDGKSALNFVRLIFFRLFQKKSNVSSLTDYFRSETKKLAGILYSVFSIGNDYERDLWFPGTKIYNYFLKDENNIDIECFKFADKVFSIICDNDFVRYNTEDTNKFKNDDCPWYTFKIRQMYIPEWILISSLSQKVSDVFFTDKETFQTVNQREIDFAKNEILKALHIKEWKDLDNEVKEYIKFVPLEVTEQEYEDSKEKEQICIKKEIKVFGIKFREAEYGSKEKKGYKETPLNTNEDFFMEKYMTWIEKMLPEDKFCQIIFNSLEHFINLANESDYELVKTKIKTIIDKIFEENDKSKSVVLNKLTEKYKAVLNDDIFKKYCQKVQESTKSVYHTLQNHQKSYENHINGLNNNNNPNNIFIKSDITINNLTDELSIYEQLISYLENNKENFKILWKDEMDNIKDNFSLKIGRVFLPLASTKQKVDSKEFQLSGFEQKIKRASQISFVKCDSINELSYGQFFAQNITT